MTKEKEFTGQALAVKADQSVALAEGEVRAETEVQASVLLARRFPRDESAVAKKIKTACNRQTFAAKGIYVYPRGGQDVIGPGINLAKEIARMWGNIQYGFEIINETDDERTIRGVAWDLESNTKAFSSDTFKKLVYRKNGGWIKPDERDLRELTNRRGAIAMRNAILAIVPRDLADEATETCLSTLGKGKKVDWQKVVTAFAEFGVTPAQLEAKIKRPVSEMTGQDRANLIGVYNAIKDGQSKVEEQFPPAVKEEPAPELMVEQGLGVAK